MFISFRKDIKRTLCLQKEHEQRKIMENQIIVKLYGKELGELYGENGRIVFRYLSANVEPSPFKMPTSNAFYSFESRNFQYTHHLPPMLADSLPDRFGSEVLKAYLASIHRAPQSLTAFERLSYIGEHGMGALEYFPQLMLSPHGDNRDSIDLSLLLKIGKEAENNKLNFQFKANEKNMLERIISISTSIGGARPKAVIGRDGSGNIISGLHTKLPPGYKHEIIKLETENTRGYGRVEYTYYQLARKSGIIMMPSSLLSKEGCHFCTQRFDRTEEGEKIHVQSLAALQFLDHNQDSYRIEDIMRMINHLSGDQRQIEQAYRRMVFNVLSANRDDHPKNTSFLMNRQGRWSLAPAYDLCYTYAPQQAMWSNVHHTTVNGKNDKITHADFVSLGKEFEVKKPDQIIEEIQDRFVAFPALAKENGVSAEKIEIIVANTQKIAKEFNAEKNIRVKHKPKNGFNL